MRFPHAHAVWPSSLPLSLSICAGFGAQAAYCASKGALIPLAKSLAVAWAPDNIQVSSMGAPRFASFLCCRVWQLNHM